MTFVVQCLRLEQELLVDMIVIAVNPIFAVIHCLDVQRHGEVEDDDRTTYSIVCLRVCGEVQSCTINA